MTTRDALEDFVAAAREFSDWCTSAPVDAPREARTALLLLSRLYAQALDLERPDDIDFDLEGQAVDDATGDEVLRRAGVLPFGHYGVIFDPLVVPPEEPVVGDLADDIADIHGDLCPGLSLYDAGHLEEARWAFAFGFRTHWGRHATSAIRALHCWWVDGEEE